MDLPISVTKDTQKNSKIFFQTWNLPRRKSFQDVRTKKNLTNHLTDPHVIHRLTEDFWKKKFQNCTYQFGVDFPWMKTFSFWIWKSSQGLIRRCVSVPNFIGMKLRTFPILYFSFRFFLEKNFIECVSSPYVENFTLLDSNLTNSMKTNFFSGATIKVIWFEIFSKWKS